MLKLLDYLLPLVDRFPYFPTANLRYRRNFVTLVSNSLDLVDEYPNWGDNITLNPCVRTTAFYLDGEEGKPDPERLEALQAILLACAEVVEPYLPHPQQLQEDLKTLKERSNQFGKDAAKLIRIAPFLYDGDGKALAGGSLAERVALEQYEVSEIQSLYSDHFSEHLAPLITYLANSKGMGELHKLTRNTLQQFVPREVLPATTYYSDNQQLHEYRLVLESVPRIYAPLRGAVGMDCSMASVPYHGLLEQARVFWVMRSDHEHTRPAGYVFVVQIEHEGQSAPMIVTINGTGIRRSDCHVIARLVAEHYQAPTLYLADWDRHSFLVNTHEIGTAFRGIACDTVRVNLPAAWDQVPSGGEYQNYYARDNLTSAVALDPRALPTQVNKVVPATELSPYPDAAIDGVDASVRAVIAYYCERAFGAEKGADYRSQLGISRDQAEEVEIVVRMYEGLDVTVEDFKRVRATFGVTLAEMGRCECVNILLGPLFRACRDEFPLTEWRNLSVEKFAEFRASLEDSFNYRQDSMIDNLASIPDEFIPEYWDVLKPYLHLQADEDNPPDIYVLRRVIKHFWSYGTIEALLGFLRAQPDMLDARLSSDRRWYDFFARAKALMSESEDYQWVVQQVYQTHVVKPGRSIFYDDLARECLFGASLMDRNLWQWQAEVMQALDFDEKMKIELDERMHSNIEKENFPALANNKS